VHHQQLASDDESVMSHTRVLTFRIIQNPPSEVVWAGLGADELLHGTHRKNVILLWDFES
jgi:hypothetical protein